MMENPVVHTSACRDKILLFGASIPCLPKENVVLCQKGPV